MKRWEVEEDENTHLEASTSSQTKTAAFAKASAILKSPPRKALSSVHNSPGRPKRVEAVSAPKIPAPFLRPQQVTDLKGKAVVRPFHSPFLAHTAKRKQAEATSTHLNPTTPARPFKAPFISGPSTPSVLETPIQRAAVSTPPSRALGVTPLRRGAVQKKFNTPFKPGMGPGEPGRALLESGSKLLPASAIDDPYGTPPFRAVKPVVAPVKKTRTFFDTSAFLI